jgi:CubicO group peptidase (beta-lactamase class C family)
MLGRPRCPSSLALAPLTLTLTLTLAACAGQAPAKVEPTACPSELADPEPARDRLAEIDALAVRARELFDIPGLAIAVVHHDELLLARGYGERELDSGKAVDQHSSFQIASNTKAFVATAVGALVADGVLDWDDRVVEHMPTLKLWSEQATRELRVRDLLSHRVGLATWAGDLMWISSTIELPTLLERLQHLPAEAGLRERYGYSNLMFVVAGELIRAKTGQPWEQFVRARLLDPLGMQRVVTRPAELDGDDNVAVPHIRVDGRWQTIDRLDVSVTGAAGALDTSVYELSKWLRMQLADGEFEGRRVVPPEVIRETRTPHIFLRVPDPDVYEPARHLRAYGLGWSLEDYRARLLVAHGGGLPGMTSRVLLIPEERLGVVVLTNSESPASAWLALQIADLFLADAPGPAYLGAAALALASKSSESSEAGREGERQAAPVPAGLERAYTNPLLGAARIVRADGQLIFEAHEHGGLRCRFAEQATVAAAGAGDLRLACTWDDPNMGVSEFGIETKGRRAPTLRFRVRPEFYDPLEYVFEGR